MVQEDPACCRPSSRRSACVGAPGSGWGTVRTPVHDRETCLEKAGSYGADSGCGPSYASANSSVPLRPWLQPYVALVLSPAPYGP